MHVPALFLTLALLSGCTSTQNASAPPPSFRFIPEGLTAPVLPPPFPVTPSWGNIGIWSDRLLDALETCNADKRAIELLEQRRLQRLNNEDNNHAEN
ncbi:Rz1-like lysis system protein LysC [Shigella sonnei]|uniref:Rz1-like lysis system protein LysC n=1 Tax=Shigella sonnei TaxID=624 RepID=UPI003F492FE0